MTTLAIPALLGVHVTGPYEGQIKPPLEVVVVSYPIGLVQASLGGSPLKAWSAEDGYLYRSMIHIVRGLNGIKGILWYQGCSDTSPEDSRTYEERFEKMVRDVRRTVHGAYEADLPYPPITDGGSRLPMLSFYEVEVEEKRVETGMS